MVTDKTADRTHFLGILRLNLCDSDNLKCENDFQKFRLLILKYISKRCTVDVRK